MNLTPWFSGVHRPKRHGVYQRTLPYGVVQYARWDGWRWYKSTNTAGHAAVQETISMYQFSKQVKWRGLQQDIQAKN